MQMMASFVRHTSRASDLDERDVRDKIGMVWESKNHHYGRVRDTSIQWLNRWPPIRNDLLSKALGLLPLYMPQKEQKKIAKQQHLYATAGVSCPQSVNSIFCLMETMLNSFL